MPCERPGSLRENLSNTGEAFLAGVAYEKPHAPPRFPFFLCRGEGAATCTLSEGRGYAKSQNCFEFKCVRFSYRKGGHVAVGILLLYLRFSLLLSHFQPIFLPFVVISSVVCRCFKAVSLVGILP